MNKDEKAFLDKHFKAGEYSVLTLMIRNDDLTKVLNHLKTSGANIVAIPSAKSKLDFEMETIKGKDT